MVIWLPLLLTACAIGDVSTPTAVPPVTIMPPPEITFQGNCNITHDLEIWLQITTQLRDDFLTAMNETAAKNKADMREGVLTMAAVRDAAHEVITPDCAANVETALSDTMNEAVSAFQAYYNGDRADLGDTVATATQRLEQITAVQNELVLRAEAQFEQALATESPG